MMHFDITPGRSLNEQVPDFAGGNGQIAFDEGEHTFIVPDDIAVIRAKLWGAGGADVGGGGGFVQGDFRVTPGEKLTVIAGHKGGVIPEKPVLGQAGFSTTPGGGASVIFREDGTALLIAGGAGSGRTVNASSSPGGGGGGLVGGSAGDPQEYNGTGGTQTSPGGPKLGNRLLGGHGSSASGNVMVTPSGGGGWFGGGGAESTSAPCASGGGSSGWSQKQIARASTIAGESGSTSSRNPGNIADDYYLIPSGRGGGAGQKGNPGRIVLLY